MAVSVVNQWSVTGFAQPSAFGTTIPPALQSTVIALTAGNSVGGGSGTPTAGNWLACITGWNQGSLPASTVAHADDIHSFWRPGNETTSTWAVSQASAKTRVAIWYTANLARVPMDVYIAPNGVQAGRACLVIELSGTGNWDSVTSIATNYAAAATTLNLAIGAPSGSSFTIAAVCGDSNAATQAFAPATWTTLATVTATNGTDHTCDAVLTSAILPSTAGSLSVNGTAGSATDLSGVIIQFLINAPSPVPASQNPAWPLVKFEAAFGGGFGTPPDQLTWTDLSARLWSWDETTGVQYQLGQIQATDLPLELDNNDNALATDNPAALFYTSGSWHPSAAFYDGLVTANTPAAWWKLADASGAGSAADSSGNAHAGTPSSVTFGNTNEAVTGDTSASFASGSTSHITTSYNPALPAVTAEGWVNLNSLSQSGNPVLMANSNTSSDHKGFVLGMSGTTPQVTFGNSSTSASVTAASALPASGWAYIAGTWDGTTVTLYVNGVSQGTAALAGTMPAGNANIGLGYNPQTASNYVNGLLAECAVYGTALSAAQVAANFTAGPAGTGIPVRLRCALGTLGTTVSNRWYVIQRNMEQWSQQITGEGWRRYIAGTATDIWSAISSSCATPYEGEVRQDAPYAWWQCNDELLPGGVLPATLLNSAAGNTNKLNITQTSATGAGPQFYFNTNSVSSSGSQPPASAIYAVNQFPGWMYGDPQASQIAYSTDNPVTNNPGSAAWQASGQAGTFGSYGWFTYVNDANFPVLANGITVEGWFNYQFYGSATASGGFPLLQQPESPLTLFELATASAPVAVLQMDLSGHLNLLTYNGATATSNSIYAGSDLRSNSWHHVAVTLTTTTWTVYVDGGVAATVSGSAAGMTSAWTYLVVNGDLGGGGGTSAGLATSLIQQASGTGTTTATITLPNPTTAGNCLVVCVGNNQGTGGIVTGITLGGAAGNFAVAKAVQNTVNADAEIWTDANCTGGQTSVVVTAPVSTQLAVLVMEFSGIVTSTPVDKTSSATTGANTWTSGATAALTQPSEIAIGAAFIPTTSGTVTGSTVVPWVNQSQVTAVTGNILQAGYMGVTSTAAVTYNGIATSGNSTNAVVIATLKTAGLAHGGNVAVSQVAVYPSQLPAWRIMAHYWAAVTGFGQLPAPQGVAVQWSASYAPDGSGLPLTQASITVPLPPPVSGVPFYNASKGIAASAVVAAFVGTGINSAPSAWSSGAAQGGTDDLWVTWTGLAPLFRVYTARAVGTETQAAIVSGSGDSFVGSYGASIGGNGASQVSGLDFIQSVSSHSTGAGSLTLTLPQPTTAGNCLVVWTGTDGGTNATVTGITLGGAAGNFAVAKAQQNGTSQDCEIWTDANCAGGQTSIVVTLLASAAVVVFAVELAGVVTTTPVDKTAGNAATSSGAPAPWTSGTTATLTQANEVALGAVMIGNSGAGMTGPVPNWANITPISVTGIGTSTFQVGLAGLSSTVAQAYAGTTTSTGSYAAVVVTLKTTGSASAPPASATAAGDTVAQRIERILTYGNVTYPGRAIDPAALPVLAALDIGGQQAGQNLGNIVQSDGGLLFIDNVGNLVYWQKTTLAAQYSSPVWSLGPAQDPYYPHFQWLADPQRVWNAIAITPYSPDGNALQTVGPSSSVTASQQQFGGQPHLITSYLQSQAEMLSQANWLLANFGVLHVRMMNIKVDAAPNPNWWSLVLGINVGDVVSMQNWQPGGGAIQGTFRVSRIKRHIEFGGQTGNVEASVTLDIDWEPPSYWA